MISSFLVKLLMLVMTFGVLLWLGYHAPRGSLQDVHSEHLPTAVVPADGQAAVEAQTREAFANTVAAVSPVQTKPAAAAASHNGPLDLNRASAEEIESLPGIGSVLAQRVVDYRTSVGRFDRIEDLRRVKGIGAKKLDRIRASVTVGVPSGKRKAEPRS